MPDAGIAENALSPRIRSAVAGSPVPPTREHATAATPSQSGLVPPGFARGTSLAALRGNVAVEDLRPGDLLFNAAGPPVRVARTLWRTSSQREDRRPPVRICADAMAQHQPRTDLVLRPDHAIYADGILVPAGLLLNGRSIFSEPIAQVSLWDVELEAPAIVLVDGVVAAGWLGGGVRFAHAAIVAARAGDTPTGDSAADEEPPASSPAAPVLEAIRRRLLSRVGLQPAAAGLRLRAGERTLRPVADGEGRLVFHLTGHAGDVLLEGADAILRLLIRDAEGLRELALDDPALQCGAPRALRLPALMLAERARAVQIVVIVRLSA